MFLQHVRFSGVVDDASFSPRIMSAAQAPAMNELSWGAHFAILHVTREGRRKLKDGGVKKNG